MRMKKSLSFVVLVEFVCASFASFALVPTASAAKMADGTAQWSPSDGMTVTFTPSMTIAAGEKIVLTFPAEAPVSSDFLFYAPGDDPVRVSGQSFVNFTRNGTDNNVEITVFGAVAADQPVTITLDTRVITGYNATVFAQQSIGINVMSAQGAPRGYGVALLTNDNTTQVTATVPLFVTLAANDTTMDLGTLSVAAVKDAVQTYTVNSNNHTGIHVSAVTDGALRDGAGNTIDNVADGAVSAGAEEYGIAVENTTNGITATAPFDAGDHSLTTTPQDIVKSTGVVAQGAFDVRYKAAISGDTVAGAYSQTVTVTVATNS